MGSNSSSSQVNSERLGIPDVREPLDERSGGGRSKWYTNSDIMDLYLRLREGDLIEFFQREYNHWAVCVKVSEDWAAIVHITRDEGITEDDVKDVLKDDRCRINNDYDEKFHINPPSQTVNQARDFLDHPENFGPFHAISNNCEHLATWCRYNVRHSEQVIRIMRARLAR